ncbi:MAG: helix-turn-helix transcriptional regulator [Acidimicrobiales bacterium]
MTDHEVPIDPIDPTDLIDPSGDRDTIAALAEPNRRALYDYITDRRDWVSREQAAEAVGIRRGVAAHHLDRLAGDGLLETDFRQLSARRGPGSGRPAKVYRRASAELSVSLPPRHYELAGRLLADAADRTRRDGTAIDEAISEAAHGEGRRIGDVARERLGRRPSRAARRADVFELLRDHGYEPDVLDDGVTVLHNCPFHLLAQDHTELICGMNLGLLDGLLSEVGDTGLSARLEPQDGCCCVRLHPVDAATERR